MEARTIDQDRSAAYDSENRDRRLRLNEEAILGYVGEQRIDFAPREWQLISYMVKNKGRAIPFQEILEKVFLNPSASHNLVIVYVLRVNRRLAAVNCSQRIESVRAVGYRWM